MLRYYFIVIVIKSTLMATSCLGIGRVRWAGSGEGSEAEVQKMIEFAQALTKPAQKVARQPNSSVPRVGKRLSQQN